MELQCAVKKYDWGKLGSASTVAQLIKGDVEIEEESPYAELWMGTHVSGPSIVKSTGVPLSQLIEEHPEYVGNAVEKLFGQDLPYLFKVLSVRKALSIQAHPNKKLARELHEQFPDIYKDANHKPELAIALTPFEALCGFRPIHEVRMYVADIPEMQRIVGPEIPKIADDEEFLRQAFASLFSLSKEKLVEETQSLLDRLGTLDEVSRCTQQAQLIENLNSQFSHDVGLFVVYFLNYVKMQPFEAIFLSASKPHAYISGDCVECMACSDNVVRAGFTPKFIDVDTLVSMLNYKGEDPRQLLFEPMVEDQFTKIYRPPVPDFAVAVIRVPAQKVCTLIKRGCGTILIVTEGSGTLTTGEVLQFGTIIFVPANKVHIIRVDEDLTMFQGMANV